MVQNSFGGAGKPRWDEYRFSAPGAAATGVSHSQESAICNLNAAEQAELIREHGIPGRRKKPLPSRHFCPAEWLGGPQVNPTVHHESTTGAPEFAS